MNKKWMLTGKGYPIEWQIKWAAAIVDIINELGGAPIPIQDEESKVTAGLSRDMELSLVRHAYQRTAAIFKDNKKIVARANVYADPECRKPPVHTLAEIKKALGR